MPTPSTANSVDGLTRLALALHYSVPPVLAIVLVNCVVVDKTFSLFQLVARRMPRGLVAACQFLYAWANCAGVATAACFVASRCDLFPGGANFAAPHRLRFESEPTCLPATTFVAIVSLCLLWTDRIVVAFFQPLLFLSSAGGGVGGVGGVGGGFRGRVLRATAVACAFMALSQNDPFALPLLALNGAMRPSAVARPRRVVAAVRGASAIVRASCAALGLLALAYPPERVARRSAAILVFVAASAGRA